MLNRAESVTFLPALMCASALPLPAAYRVARRVGRVAATLEPERKEACISRLVRRLEVTTEEAERIAVRAFELKYTDVLDAQLLPRLTTSSVPQLMTYEGLDNLDAALAQGRGAVLYCAHVWGSRLAITCLALLGYRIVLVRRRLDAGGSNQPFLHWVNERSQHFFESAGGRVLGSTDGEGSVEMGAVCVGALRRNEIVVLNPDVVARRIRPGDVRLRFLNGGEIFRPGGAMIAWATGSPLLCLGVHRDPGSVAGRSVIGSPLEPTPNVRATLSAQVAEMEADIRSDPACWRTWLKVHHNRPDLQQQSAESSNDSS